MNVETAASEHVAAEAFPQAKPKWTRVELPTDKKYTELHNVVGKYDLHTICISSSCPNMGEYWDEGTATFMILGNICTCSCSFCGMKTGRSETLDWEESEKVARFIKLMNILHAIFTSVDRNDLKDMRSITWAETVRAVCRMNPNTTMETLTPDFRGVERNLNRILEAAPEIISHNTETICHLTCEVRVQAKYDRSLGVLKYLKENGTNHTKPGVMLGLGEREERVIETSYDLKRTKVDIVTIGQYLQPSKRHLLVRALIIPEQFARYREVGMSPGFRHVENGALVRSSYRT